MENVTKDSKIKQQFITTQINQHKKKAKFLIFPKRATSNINQC